MKSFLKFVAVILLALAVALGTHNYELAHRIGVKLHPSVISDSPRDLYIAPLENGCVLDAEQAYYKLPEGLWKHIVVVWYDPEFGGGGHAMLLFDIGGQVWVYDRIGARSLGTDSHDLKIIIPLIIHNEHQPIVEAEVLL